jgi:hypothetical protein
MKNTIWTIIAVAMLGALGTTPAHASSGGGFLCNLPIIGKLLCPPTPGGGGGGGNSVPEPASLAILAAGAGMVGAAVRRRRMRK